MKKANNILPKEIHGKLLAVLRDKKVHPFTFKKLCITYLSSIDFDENKLDDLYKYLIELGIHKRRLMWINLYRKRPLILAEYYKYKHRYQHFVAQCRQLSKKFNIGAGLYVAKMIKSKINSNKKIVNNTVESEQFAESSLRKLSKRSVKHVYIITWAQNNTSINKNLLDNIIAYKNYINKKGIVCEFIVIPGRYKNPTTLNNKSKDEYWDKELNDYLISGTRVLNEDLLLLGDMKIQPTAANPLSGIYGIGKGKSVIIGHPKQHFHTLPTLSTSVKLIATTGAITKINYTDSKAGKKGAFHHIYGFCIIESNGTKYTLRQVSAEINGSFYDLNNHVSNKKVLKTKSVPCIVLGDAHFGKHDEVIYAKTKELCKKLNCESVVLHDIMDSYSISHHHENNILMTYKKNMIEYYTLKKEIDVLSKYLTDIVKNVGINKKYYVVRSNHDEHLDKWLNKGMLWNNISNLDLLLKGLVGMVISGKTDMVLPLFLRDKMLPEYFNRFVFLNRTEELRIKGWLLSIHGDIGINGARGSIVSFANMNTKMVIGHTHSPVRFNNVAVVGTMGALIPDYSKGVNKFANCHFIIQPNGKGQLLLFRDRFLTMLV